MFIKDILTICNGKLLCGNDDIAVSKFSKDTRTISKGEIYVGIKGEKFDGNDYIANAFEKGASAAITDKSDLDITEFKDKTIIKVSNSIDALCDMAKNKRDNFNGMVVGVTGSVGKTTTKDLIASVLSKKYKVLKTEESFNNNIGLPLSILNNNGEVWVIEMGMNGFGEISYLSKIVKPSISVITNIGTSHIGLLGSRENILKAKLEILDGMSERILIINNDNDLLHKYYLENKDGIITVGINNNSMYNAIISNNVLINNKECNLFSNEEPLVIDSLLAYAVGKELKVDDKKIIEALEHFKQEGNRLKEDKSQSGFIIINDAFNASFDSVKLAIDYLSKYSNKKVLVLGDMLELGKYSKKLHTEVGKYISRSNISTLITVGNESLYISNSAIENGFTGKIKHFYDNEKCYEYIKKTINKDDVVLFKASKKMNFVSLCDKIKKL